MQKIHRMMPVPEGLTYATARKRDSGEAGLHKMRQMHRGLSQRGTELLIRKADWRFSAVFKYADVQ